MNIRIRITVALTTVEAVQVGTYIMDLVLRGQCDTSKGEPINIFTGQRDEKPKDTCN
jgi:hypothetical protein